MRYKTLIISKWLSLLLILAVCASSVQIRIQEVAKRPNILVLMADDAGGKDFGCYGHPTLKTPNIDKLASSGILFSNAFLTTSSCSPSRTSILTGQYAHSIGTEDMHVPLPAGVRIVPSYLQEQGYYTGNMFKTHYGTNGEKQFQWYSKKLGDFTKFLDQREDAPFFMWMGFNDPHRPYNESEYKNPFDPTKVIVPPHLTDTPETRQDLANYYSEITRLDGEIGWVMAELEKRGLLENTLVVFLSDNGAPFPGSKGTLYDTGIQTPLIMSWPEKTKGNQRYNELVSSIDLAPTFLEAAGIAVPENMAGQSMLPIILKKGQYNRKYAMSERNWHGIDEHMRSVRTLDFKLITNEYTGFPHGTPSDISESPSWLSLYGLNQEGKLNAFQSRLFMPKRPQTELYDVRKDPNEMQNLAADPAYAKVVKELKEVLVKWQSESRDVSVNEHIIKDKTDRFTGKVVK